MTGLLHVVSLFLYPNLICGCHFHAEAALVSLIPFAWGLYPYLRCRSLRERLVGYVSMALAIPWFWLAWDSNLRFFLVG